MDQRNRKGTFEMISPHDPTVTTALLQGLVVTPPIPDARGYTNGRWAPIPHVELVGDVLRGIGRRGWLVTEVRYALARNGATLVVSWDVTMPAVPPPPGFRWAIGVVNSNDRRKALRFSIGATEVDCDSGLVVGSAAWPHTVGMKLPAVIDHALDLCGAGPADTPSVIDAMRDTPLSPGEVEHLVCAMALAGVVPWARCGDLYAAYANPPWDAWGSGTAWTLYRAAAYVIRRSPPLYQMEQLERLLDLFRVGTAVVA